MIRKIFVLLTLALAVGSVVSVANATLPQAQVFIVPGSDINMVSRESKVPVSVQNDYDRPVRIRVHAQTTNASLNVQEYVSLTVPANSRKDALVPVTAIASGSFTVKVWVTTFTDLRLGATTEIKLTANPDIELFLLVGFALLILILLALGVIRMRRRKQNA
jgi:protein-disulfide isomerase